MSGQQWLEAEAKARASTLSSAFLTVADEAQSQVCSSRVMAQRAIVFCSCRRSVQIWT